MVYTEIHFNSKKTKSFKFDFTLESYNYQTLTAIILVAVYSLYIVNNMK